MENSRDTVHISLRLFQKPSQKVSVEEVLESDLGILREKLAKKVDNLPESLTFIHRGRLLKSGIPLQNQGITSESLIQAVPKASKPTSVENKEPPRFTEVDVQDIIFRFRSVSKDNFLKASRPEFLEKILQGYPKLRNNLSAVSILRDPILLASIGNPLTVYRLEKEHRDLLDATKLIVDTLNSKAVTVEASPNEAAEDLSDSSEGSESASPSTSRGRGVRRITTNQVAQALGQVLASSGAFSANSLANISQRNLSSQSSTEMPAPPPAAPPATPPSHITTSMFMNALTEVLRSTRANNERNQSAETPRPEATPPPAASQEGPTPPMYASELQQMREMGLNDTEINLQALILSNGDLENAINIVLSGGTN